ncbi:hypothetical protein [Haloarcula laminariae]|uniref:hypothetical protein n=1 Tax=Haloarcula laminariae TaxID=2961577 RepID=UPI002404B5E4|nr:hypothetical protein [Halomicroarcula sp. FL173]
MTDSKCRATNRNGDPCKLPAGWGTDHTGDGRCKLHGGNAGAPSNNQNAAKHSLNSDPHYYYESLSREEKQLIEDFSKAFENRVIENTGSIEHQDRLRARKTAIKLHSLSEATAYIGSQSDALQESATEQSFPTEIAPLLKKLRRYDDSIFQNLKQLGVFDEPESQDTGQLQEWRVFIEDSS